MQAIPKSQNSSRLAKIAPFFPQHASHRRSLQTPVSSGYRVSTRNKLHGKDRKVKRSASNPEGSSCAPPVPSFVWSPPVVPSQSVTFVAHVTPCAGPVECREFQTASPHDYQGRAKSSPPQRPHTLSPRNTNATSTQVPSVIIPNHTAQYSNGSVPNMAAPLSTPKRIQKKIQNSRRVSKAIITPTSDVGKWNTLNETHPQITGSPTVMGPPPPLPQRPQSACLASHNRGPASRAPTSGIHQFLQFQCNLARATKDASDEDWKRFASTYFSTDIKLLLSHTEKSSRDTMSSVLNFQDIPQYYKCQYDAGIVQMQFMLSQLNEHCLYDRCHVVSDHFTLIQYYETGRLVQFEGSLHARYSKDMLMEILLFRFDCHCEYIDMASLPTVPNAQDPSGDGLILVPKSAINEYGLGPAVFQLLGAGTTFFTDSQPPTEPISDTAIEHIAPFYEYYCSPVPAPTNSDKEGEWGSRAC